MAAHHSPPPRKQHQKQSHQFHKRISLNQTQMWHFSTLFSWNKTLINLDLPPWKIGVYWADQKGWGEVSPDGPAAWMRSLLTNGEDEAPEWHREGSLLPTIHYTNAFRPKVLTDTTFEFNNVLVNAKQYVNIEVNKCLEVFFIVSSC